MAILVDEGTKVVVAGITGSEGTFHSLRNRTYGTDVVAGVTPGKGGRDVEGIPVFDTVADAVEGTGANTSLIFVPARFAPEAIYEAADAGIGLVVCITEGIPVRDMAQVVAYLRGHRRLARRAELSRRDLTRPLERRDHPRRDLHTRPGRARQPQRHPDVPDRARAHPERHRPVNVRGDGGDPVHGIGFIGALERFEADPETDLVVMIGEIGGDDEEHAASFITDHVTKPVVAYIAGFTAPPGKRMGHAGAIITGSSGTAQAKAEALEAADVRVGRTPTEVAQLVRTTLS